LNVWHVHSRSRGDLSSSSRDLVAHKFIPAAS
jgi:hypothetical protein